jgi:MYXO-CTERM domain-containing protein
MVYRRRTLTTTLSVLSPAAAIALLAAGHAEAATPTYYNSRAAFQIDITNTVNDDYQHPAYVGNQSNAVMSAVLGQTDYMTTGFANWNLVVGGGRYCAGCNGSFQLSFQTTSVGNAIGVNGVGLDIMAHDVGLPYYAYITFGDGTTANIQLTGAGTFWGVAAPERIQSIHIGLSMGAATQNGYFEMDNLIVGDGNIGTCEVDADCIGDGNPCTDAICDAGLCTHVANTAPCDDGNPCTDETCSGGNCVPQFNTNPCDDGEVCTENDVCAFGLCQGSLVSCDDGNPCTTNYCDFGTGCALLNNSNPCDDGNPCTAMDACSAGACTGSPTSCDDDDACTVDSCDPVAGCVHDPAVGCCLGDEDCGDDERCEDNACVPASAGSSEGDTTTGTPPGETGLDGTGGGESGVVTAGPGSDGTATTAGADAGDTTGPSQDDGPTASPSGCGCTTDPDGDAPWWLMVLLGVLPRRRRAR